MIKHNPVD